MLSSSLSFLHSSSLSFLPSSSSSSSSLFTIPTPNPRNRSSSLLSFVVQAKSTTRREDRIARHIRIRKTVEGTPERPRMAVFRSNKHLYVQVIDDTKMHTLAAVSTMQKALAEEFNYTAGPTIEVAKRVGEIIAKSCLEKGITKVTFDRGGYPYHGRIKAIAEGAREQGLEF